MPGTAVIAGFGPGFCEELAWTLAEEGHPVGLIARSQEYSEDVADRLREAGHEAIAIPADLTDPDRVEACFDRLRDAFGPIEVLAHTASTVTSGSDVELDPDRLERLWRLYAYAGLCCFREALADLRGTGGTALFFGAAPEAGDFAFKSGKGATRGLARSLADEYHSEGIHVAHVVIDGMLLNPDVYEGPGEVDEDDYIDPAAAARSCYQLIDQPDRARTFEIDLHARDPTTGR
ncbi:SDR family NAD(P)-dependent oxidoreductase [Halopenitus salinus]|uniref:SDR family NAD(P)-dependent oxidoreductase n=1 Tax=Halopenitus salinus TaxID=1198295 RepID=A0ABD5UV39_9EURY